MLRSKTAPVKRSTRTKLAIARAQLSVYRKTLTGQIPEIRVVGQPARFISAWAVNRGYSGITQALDEDGQVWERVSHLENKVLIDSWWEPLPMTRKAARKVEKKAESA